MKFFTATIFIAMLALTNIAQAACNSTANGGSDLNIQITISQNIVLGSLTRPDTGSATVIIGADGSRTLPPELNVGRNNPDVFNQATAIVTGTAGCLFKITVGTITGKLSNVTLAPAASYSLSSTSSGAKGTLDNLGSFEFAIGVSDIIDSATTTVGGTFNVIVEYSD